MKKRLKTKPKKARAQNTFFDNFKRYLLSAWEIVKLNPHTINNVAKDKNATMWGLLFVIIAGAAAAIGMLTFSSIIGFAMGYFIWSVLFVGLLWIIAKIFRGKASFVEQYRAQSLGLLVYWIGVIPFIGSIVLWIAELWFLVMSIHIIKETHQLKTWKAILVVVIPVIALFALMILLVTTFISMGFISEELLYNLTAMS